MTEGTFPPPSGPDALRIGDGERHEAMHVLNAQLSAGRLSLIEYDRRTGIVASASTVGQLRSVFADLPAPWPSSLLPPMPYPSAPFAGAWQPGAMRPGYSDKSKLLAGVLQILIPIGIGRFYTGHTGLGIAQLLVAILTCGLGSVWSFVDGIVILVKGGTDNFGRPLSH